MRIISWLLSNIVALAVAAWMLPGISVDGVSGPMTEEIVDKAPTVLGVAIVFGIVSAVVKPVVQFLSIPLILLTLGLFLLVVNALMLMLTGWISGEVGLGFEVDGFWWAVLGALVITLVTALVDSLLGDD